MLVKCFCIGSWAVITRLSNQKQKKCDIVMDNSRQYCFFLIVFHNTIQYFIMKWLWNRYSRTFYVVLKMWYFWGTVVHVYKRTGLLEESAAQGTSDLLRICPLNAVHFGTINWLYKSTMVLFVVESSQVMAAVNIAEGHLKYVLNIYYHAWLTKPSGTLCHVCTA